MNWTNKYGLPQPMVRAIQFEDRPEAKPREISATTLIKPAQALALQRLHDHEITQDVADHIYRLLGQSVHAVIEKACEDNSGDMPEQKFYTGFEGWTIYGTSDLIEASAMLDDFKVTSVYSLLLGEKPEWTAQANIYKWLAERNGVQVNDLRIIAILRDWQASKVGQDEDYPPAPCSVVKIEIWPTEKTEEYIRGRLRAHEAAAVDPSSVPCSSDERWERKGAFAVMKKGGKRAMRLLPTYEEATNYIRNTGLPDLQIDTRPTMNRKCESFCLSAPWCTQWADIKAGKPAKVAL